VVGNLDGTTAGRYGHPPCMCCCRHSRSGPLPLDAARQWQQIKPLEPKIRGYWRHTGTSSGALPDQPTRMTTVVEAGTVKVSLTSHLSLPWLPDNQLTTGLDFQGPSTTPATVSYSSAATSMT
jgi:hypothetical protein